MSMRVGVTPAELPGSEGEAFLVAWPWSNDPAHITPDLAEAIRTATGGLPIVLVVSGADGNRTFYGAPEHAAIAACLDFKTIRWQFIEVDHDPPDDRHYRLLAA